MNKTALSFLLSLAILLGIVSCNDDANNQQTTMNNQSNHQQTKTADICSIPENVVAFKNWLKATVGDEINQADVHTLKDKYGFVESAWAHISYDLYYDLAAHSRSAIRQAVAAEIAAGRPSPKAALEQYFREGEYKLLETRLEQIEDAAKNAGKEEFFSKMKPEDYIKKGQVMWLKKRCIAADQAVYWFYVHVTLDKTGESVVNLPFFAPDAQAVLAGKRALDLAGAVYIIHVGDIEKILSSKMVGIMNEQEVNRYMQSVGARRTHTDKDERLVRYDYKEDGKTKAWIRTFSPTEGIIILVYFDANGIVNKLSAKF